MTAPMNPTVLTFLKLFSNPGRRRKLLSALVIGLAFIVGIPVKGGATPGRTPGVADVVTITITRDYAIANLQQDIITVHVSPAPSPKGEKINFSWLGFGTDITTDANGDAVLYLSGVSAGTVSVKTKREDGTDIGTVVVTFISGPGPVDVSKSYIEVIHSPETADGASEDIVRAHLFDQYGNALTDTVVTFSILSGTASFSSASTGKTISGILDAKLVSNVIGDVQVGATVKVNGVDVYISNGSTGNSVTVQFIAGSPDPTKSYIMTVHSPEAADGISEDIVRVYLFDKSGHPLTDTIVTFVILGGTASFSSPSTGPTGGGAGSIDAKLVSNVVGSVQVGATVKINGADVFISNNAGGTAVTVKFVVGPPDVTNQETQLVVDKKVATADGVMTTMIHAHLVDKAGRLIDYPVDLSFFVIPSGSADGTAVLVGGGSSLTPDANGDIYLTITNTTVGTVLLGATVTFKGVTSTITFGSPAPVKFVDLTLDPSNPANLLVVDKGTATADGVDFTTIQAHLVNAAGSPAKNQLVTLVFFIIPSGGPEATAVLTMIGGPNPVMTDGNGDVYLNITNTKIGTVQLGCTISGIPITTGSPAPVKFVSGVAVPSAPGAPNGTGTMLTIIKNFAPANGIATDIVNAHITDALGNPVKDTTVTFSIRIGGTSTATAQLVGIVQVKTDANGNAVMNIINTVGGTVWIDATIIYNGNPTALIDGSYKEVTFTNFPDVNNPLTNLSVVANNALADGQSVNSVKAHIVDQNGVPLEGDTVVFTIQSGNGQIITTGPWVTNSNGDVVIDITSNVAGNVLITATVGNLSIKFGSPAKVRFVAINIYVPHVFTPNGDGTNDVLKPILVGISQFHYFSIYNRWGNLIFTTQDANMGWDGRFKGVVQPVETYLWIAEGVTTEGKTIVQKGMVSLVR